MSGRNVIALVRNSDKSVHKTRFGDIFENGFDKWPHRKVLNTVAAQFDNG